MFPQHLPDYIKGEIAIEAQELAGNASDDVEGIDRQDFYSGVLYAVAHMDLDAATGDGDVKITVYEDEESGGSYTDEVTSETFTIDHDDDALLEIDLDLKSNKRYLKVEVEGEEGASDTITISGVLVLGGAVDKPVS